MNENSVIKIEKNMLRSNHLKLMNKIRVAKENYRKTIRIRGVELKG